MQNDTVQAEIDKLITDINQHNYNYYILATPTISDYDFDMLLKKLEKWEAQYPQFKRADSPTLRVGGEINKTFVSFVHLKPMLSLGNSYSLEDIEDFNNQVVKLSEGRRFTYMVEHKFDGVSMSLHYEKGILVRAVTRGDGVQGDEVTANVRTIRNVPLKLRGEQIPDFIEVRGEVLMHRKAFDKWNDEREQAGEDRTMNPRNATAGSLKSSDSNEVSKRPLTFYAYQIANDEQNSATDGENMQNLAAWGFPTGGNHKVCKDIAEVMAYINQWDNGRFGLDYDIDGIVIKVNEVALRDILGSTAKAPRWGIAFKYPAASVTTQLLSVDFQVGRTGKITPVANLKPILLAGTIVKRASVHNADEIERLDLHENDVVMVEKGGEIIPKITAVVKEKRADNAKKIHFVTHCPACSTELIRLEKEANHFCYNDNACPPQLKGKVEHFAHRKAMNIDGLGTEIVSQLIDSGLVKNYADLYSLTYQQVIKLEGFADTSAKNLIAAVAASTSVPFERVLFAMGIPNVGSVKAKKLVKYFGSLEKMAQANKETLSNLTDIGETIAQSILDFFQNPYAQQIIKALENAGLQLAAAESDTPKGTALAGKNFVISGTFENFSRDGLKEYIESLGGEVKSSVSKKTSFLIAGAEAGGSKLEKANKDGVKIISEKDFLELVGR
ncbi:MAG: NAD-dependent DNA ligase LigA [Bacteroidales bacterium]